MAHKLIQCCTHALNIMHKYYQFETLPDIEPFLLSPSPDSATTGQVLIQEEIEEVYIGLQFGADWMADLESNILVTTHHASVIAEELSHFKCLVDAVEQRSQVSLLELEVLGEIDRFLCLLHWNCEGNMGNLNLSFDWKNIHQLCDHVFQGQRFKEKDLLLYIKAEALAYKHLKEAFATLWDDSMFDFSKIHKPAQMYFSKLRKQVLRSF